MVLNVDTQIMQSSFRTERYRVRKRKVTSNDGWQTIEAVVLCIGPPNENEGRKGQGRGHW